MNDATADDIKKSKKGRPRVESTPVMVRLSPFQLQAIDDWRRQQDTLPNRPEAIRALVELGVRNAHEFAFKAKTEAKDAQTRERRAARKRRAEEQRASGAEDEALRPDQLNSANDG